MGLVLSLAAGVTNMVLDYVFIRVFGMGVAGAALATILGYVVGGIIPFFYFLSSKRDGVIKESGQSDFLYQRFFGNDEQCGSIDCWDAF